MAKRKDKELSNIKDTINAKLAESGTTVASVEKTSIEGQYSMTLAVDKSKINDIISIEKKKQQNPLSPLVRERKGNTLSEILASNKEIELLSRKLEAARIKDTINNGGKEVAKADVRYRDKLDYSNLDLRDKSADTQKALELYDRSEQEYYRTGIYGSTIDILSNFATTGYSNEINDIDIKDYFDSWVYDIGFISILRNIFHSLFKNSVCYILKAEGSYEPNADGISSIPGKEPTKKSSKAHVASILDRFVRKTTGAGMDFKEFSKVYDEAFKEEGKGSGVPTNYSILDPRYITVNGGGLFNKQTYIFMKAGYKNLKDLLKRKKENKLGPGEKESLKLIPSALLKAVEENQDYIFQEGELSVIYARKNDFEMYAKPKGSRAFDAFDYKDELKKADFATVDGIYNFILKVTVGDKDNPVTDLSVLENLADAFNTPQKAFAIVWNHTLHIEKITTNEIGAILGKAKYEPVESDINVALGLPRAMIDGGTISPDAAVLASKSIKSEIYSIRQEVEKWIYSQYKLVAKAAGFSTYPLVRWREAIVTTDGDAVTRASMMQLVDRKLLSVETVMRELGYDYHTEINRMDSEMDLINSGILRAGSPFQPTGPNGDVKPTPSGSTKLPSKAPIKPPTTGRPSGKVTSPKKKPQETKVVKRKTEVPSPAAASAENIDIIEELINELNKLPEDQKLKILNNVITKDGSKE